MAWENTWRMTAARSAGRQRLEEPDLALAQDEHAAFAEVLVETRKREPGLLGMRVGDAPVDAGGAGQELEVDPPRFGQVAEQRRDRHAGSGIESSAS